jgi:hypothetical protein
MRKSPLLIVFILCFLFPTPGIPYFFRDGYNYGPACQWIRMRGELQVEHIDMEEKFSITIYYQFEEQKNPATLVINYPIKPGNFSVVFSGFDEKIDGVNFVSPGFFFEKEIKFYYFVKSTGGQWKSETKEIVYHPERIEKNGEVLCQSDLELDPIKL